MSQLHVLGPDGTERCVAEGLIHEGSITVEDTSIVVEPGDEIRRRLPNGRDEVFLVQDVRYINAFDTIPARYKISISKKGTSFRPNGTTGYHINVSGLNARVNIGSTDNSTNISSTEEIFNSLSSALQASTSDSAKIAELLTAIEEMKRQKSGSDFVSAYQKFISLAADHMTIVAPFLPALTTFLK